MNTKESFYSLDPENVLLAAEEIGLLPNGEFTQLNSYENRVFDVKLEEPINDNSDNKNVIVKFYRPQRWSKEAISEEHEFLFDLKKEGVPAVAPLMFENNQTILEWNGLYASFFPKIMARMPQEFFKGDLKKIGRLMAQVHNVGAKKTAPHRPILDSHYFGGWDSLDILQERIAPELRMRYNAAAEDILYAIEDQVDTAEFIRIHGDCHKGNILQNSTGYFLVDFDDFSNGPVIQDFWMLLSGDDSFSLNEREEIIEGYEELREFPHHQWDWVPLYRGLRIIYYAGWIARRWEDPSFPRLFPQYNSYSYWAEEVEALEKIAWKLRAP